MHSQLSSCTLGSYPADVLYQLTHHINHLIKTVFFHPVDGCSQISDMGKISSYSLFLLQKRHHSWGSWASESTDLVM